MICAFCSIFIQTTYAIIQCRIYIGKWMTSDAYYLQWHGEIWELHSVWFSNWQWLWCAFHWTYKHSGVESRRAYTYVSEKQRKYWQACTISGGASINFFWGGKRIWGGGKKVFKKCQFYAEIAKYGLIRTQIWKKIGGGANWKGKKKFWRGQYPHVRLP